MLNLEKSLVYFSTSLKSDEVTLNKIAQGRIIPLYEDDQDLLEDVLVEVHQAIEMANIYSGTLSGTMDAFASIISNNLNIVMKVPGSSTARASGTSGVSHAGRTRWEHSRVRSSNLQVDASGTSSALRECPPH